MAKPLYRIALKDCNPKPDGNSKMKFTIPTLTVDTTITITNAVLVAETDLGVFTDIQEVNMGRSWTPCGITLDPGCNIELTNFDITLP